MNNPFPKPPLIIPNDPNSGGYNQGTGFGNPTIPKPKPSQAYGNPLPSLPNQGYPRQEGFNLPRQEGFNPPGQEGFNPPGQTSLNKNQGFNAPPLVPGQMQNFNVNTGIPIPPMSQGPPVPQIQPMPYNKNTQFAPPVPGPPPLPNQQFPNIPPQNPPGLSFPGQQYSNMPQVPQGLPLPNQQFSNIPPQNPPGPPLPNQQFSNIPPQNPPGSFPNTQTSYNPMMQGGPRMPMPNVSGPAVPMPPFAGNPPIRMPDSVNTSIPSVQGSLYPVQMSGPPSPAVQKPLMPMPNPPYPNQMSGPPAPTVQKPLIPMPSQPQFPPNPTNNPGIPNPTQLSNLNFSNSGPPVPNYQGGNPPPFPGQLHGYSGMQMPPPSNPQPFQNSVSVDPRSNPNMPGYGGYGGQNSNQYPNNFQNPPVPMPGLQGHQVPMPGLQGPQVPMPGLQGPQVPMPGLQGPPVPMSGQPNPQFNSFPKPSGQINPMQGSVNLQSDQINCDPQVVDLFITNNIHTDIAKKYNYSSIIPRANKFQIQALASDISNLMKELQDSIKKLTLDPNARWTFLENDGIYKLYDHKIAYIIENTYKTYIYELINPNYENYSLSADFDVNGQKYQVQFAKLGGVHRQIKKGVNDTIRAVKRVADNEELNKDFIRNYIWMWRHESGQFRNYEDDAIFLIEMSFIEWRKNPRQSPIALIQGCNGKTYKIDFQSFKQENEITGYGREIKRDPPS